MFLCVHFTYYWTLDLNQSPFILVRLHQQVIIVKAKTDRTLLLLHHPKQHMTTNNSHWIVTVCVIKQCCEELSHFYTHHTFLQHSYHASSSYLTHLSVQAYLRDNTTPMALGKKILISKTQNMWVLNPESLKTLTDAHKRNQSSFSLPFFFLNMRVVVFFNNEVVNIFSFQFHDTDF